MGYSIKIDTDAYQDIKDAALWYEEQAQGLGGRYKAQVVKQIDSLKKNPLIVAVRYANVRCMKIKKFPFLVHYTVEESMVTIYAVIHTSRNPEIWKKRIDI